MSKASDLARLMTSGSTAVHGEASVTASGSTGLTTNLQQGLTKHWLNLDGTGTIAITDSFNCASVTDDGTGDYDPFFTNNMSNSGYSVSGSCPSGSGDASVTSFGSLATNKYRLLTTDGGSNLEDQDPVMSKLNGDLA